MWHAFPLIISVASLFVSLACYSAARSSLTLSEHVAERARKEWKQRKWFDLYLKASEFYDFFDLFQRKYGTVAPAFRAGPEIHDDYVELVSLVRKVHAMATVFPKNEVLDALFASTAPFKDPDDAFSPERLQRISDAVEGLRQKALLGGAVFD
jgi:hypothetical protein